MRTRKKQLNLKEKLDKFDKYLAYSLTNKTKLEYMKVARALLEGSLEIKSKSRYLQAQAVAKKLQSAGIDYIVIPKWQKRGDSRNLEYIQSKLIGEEEFNKILNCLPDTERGKELSLALKIAFYSGLRLHEILKLTDRSVKINLHIVISVIGKGGKFRKTYLPMNMIGEMREFKSFNIGYSYARNTLARSSKKAGVKTSFHALRHSFLTRLIQQSIPLPKVQKIAGHSNITTTALYLHFTDEIDESLERLGY